MANNSKKTDSKPKGTEPNFLAEIVKSYDEENATSITISPGEGLTLAAHFHENAADVTIEPLKEEDQQLLQACEARIKAGIDVFHEVAIAFCVIQQKQLFRWKYNSFTDYCAGKWSYTRDNGYKLAQAGRVLMEMKQIGAKVLPTSRRAASELADVPNADREPMLKEAIKKNGKATAKGVADVKKSKSKSGCDLEVQPSGGTDTGIAKDGAESETPAPVIVPMPEPADQSDDLIPFSRLLQLADVAFDLVGTRDQAEVQELSDIIETFRTQLKLHADRERAQALQQAA